MKNSSKSAVSEKIADIAYGMDYPVDAIFDIPSVRIVGSNIAIIEGCKGLIEYSNNRISINLGAFEISLFGNELVMENLSKTVMNVTGGISSIAFDKRASR
ncbi:MAG: YabP/YqfC family sporulation protein [Oscillospiraceae bacterium]